MLKMRKAIENQGNRRTPTEYGSPKSKVKDPSFQQHLQLSFSSSHQETPMKPSQVPNRLSQPPHRRILPPQITDLCHRDRPDPRPPSHILGSYQPPSSPTSIGRPNRTPRDKLCPSQYSVQLQFVPVTTTKIDTLANRPHQSTPCDYHHMSSQLMRDLTDHAPPLHTRRYLVTDSKVTLCNSGSKIVTTKRQESNKAQSSDAKTSIPTIQLQRPPVTSLLKSRPAHQLYRRPPDSEQLNLGSSQGYEFPHSPQVSDANTDSGLLTVHNKVPGQEPQNKSTPSSNMQIPVVDLNCSTPKRQRDFEESGETTKKLCVQGANPGKAHTPKPASCTSHSTSKALSSKHSPFLELSPRTTDSRLCTEPFDSSGFEERASTTKPCLKRPPMGAKQAFINSCQNNIVKLRSSKSEENDESSSLISFNMPWKDHQSGCIPCKSSVEPLKTPSTNKQVGERRRSSTCTPKPALKSNSGCSSRLVFKRNKAAHPRRRPVIPDDIDELFTPDPKTYIVSPTRKLVKPKIDMETVKLPISEKCPSGTGATSSTTVTGSSCHKTKTFKTTGPLHGVDTKMFSSEFNPQVFLPTVALVRVKSTLNNDEHFSSKARPPQNNPISSGKLLKDKSGKSDEKLASTLPKNASSHISEMDNGASKHKSSCSQSPPLERQTECKKQVNEEDPIDMELGLSFALDLDVTQSSHSSEEEQLLSLQELMEQVTKTPDTPEKGAFSEPSTPGHHISQLKDQQLQSTTNLGIYKNSLDQMLKEINTNKKAKEIETQLLTACKEDLLRIAEFEKAEEIQEEGISTEQQEFLQRYSLMSNAIREVPPGEIVFNLEKFGQIFNQDTLQLRQCMVNPQGAAQKTLLWSSPAQLRLHVTIGLFHEAYDCSFCPAQVTRFLFKMMSVHSERLVSEMMLQALCDIACTAAYQRVKNGNQQFKVWVPSLADVTLVVMNMGVAFVTLFPFENLQPSFTEGDLLEEEHVKIQSPSSNKELNTFPEHNCNNILKYLSYCMGLCPRAYSDDELLLLLTVVGRIGLDPRLILQFTVDLYPVQYKIVNNIRSWDTMLPRICQAYTDLTNDHHNMCLLVQRLPDSMRGRQLRRHLSLSMISKLLDGNCTYRPTEKELQLSKLRPYLPRMQPSTILRGMLNAFGKSQKDKEEDMATLDQQAYYFCYSLLTLANEASNFQFFPTQQKEQLLFLSYELETHVKCDIRESEKCLYRSKVKDLVARIYTKWQMLLQRTRPLHGKLYDYWQPPNTDAMITSQEEQITDNSDDGEGTVGDEDPEMEGDEQEKETSRSDENEVVMINEEHNDQESLEGQKAMKSD